MFCDGSFIAPRRAQHLTNLSPADVPVLIEAGSSARNDILAAGYVRQPTLQSFHPARSALDLGRQILPSRRAFAGKVPDTNEDLQPAGTGLDHVEGPQGEGRGRPEHPLHLIDEIGPDALADDIQRVRGSEGDLPGLKLAERALQIAAVSLDLEHMIALAPLASAPISVVWV